jgi:hypothetical protein
MKKISLYFFVILSIFNSCSPKLRYSISNAQTPLSEKDNIVILREIDTSKVDGTLIGSLFSGDNGLSVNCSYYQIMGNFKSVARKNGANIIKIINHKYPDRISSCDRVTAELYRVSNPLTYEKEIEWSDRRLIWEDFKGKPRAISNNRVGAQTYTQITYQSDYSTLITTPKIFTKAIFDCELSWVRNDQLSNSQLLQHEQGHFDICELYRRKLQKEFDTHKMTSTNLNILGNEIFRLVYKDYNDRQELYEEETQYGLNAQKQQEWQNNIAKELNELNGYRQQ